MERLNANRADAIKLFVNLAISIFFQDIWAFGLKTWTITETLLRAMRWMEVINDSNSYYYNGNGMKLQNILYIGTNVYRLFPLGCLSAKSTILMNWKVQTILLSGNMFPFFALHGTSL